MTRLTDTERGVLSRAVGLPTMLPDGPAVAAVERILTDRLVLLENSGICQSCGNEEATLCLTCVEGETHG